MAPMTRARATREAVPTSVLVTYYGLRSGAGLIIPEGTGISRAGLGWPYAPGIRNEEQIEKWKPITQAVHEKRGKISCQLWHMGRAVSETSFSYLIRTYEGKKPAEVAHEHSEEEIQGTIQDYAIAAKNSLRAGFDGVEIHAGNVYLIDQFLRDSANKRTGKYGGSIKNRVRFLDEVVSAVTQAVGSQRTSVRLSPNGDTFGVIDSNPAALFTEAAKVLKKHKVAMLDLREVNAFAESYGGGTEQPKEHEVIRKAFSGVLVLDQEYSREEAMESVANGTADAIGFGRFFITNPDVVLKLKNNEPLGTHSDAVKWFYSRGTEGYHGEINRIMEK